MYVLFVVTSPTLAKFRKLANVISNDRNTFDMYLFMLISIFNMIYPEPTF